MRFLFILLSLSLTYNLLGETRTSQSDLLAEARYLENNLLNHIAAAKIYKQLAEAGNSKINAIALYRLGAVQHKLGHKPQSVQSFSRLLKNYSSDDDNLLAVLNESAYTSPQQEVKRKKHSIDFIIPRANFVDTPLSECVAEINKICKSVAPKSHVNLVYLSSAKKNSIKTAKEPLINLSVEKVPYKRLIMWLANGSGLKYKFEEHISIIADPDIQLYPLETLYYIISDEFINNIQKNNPNHEDLSTLFQATRNSRSPRSKDLIFFPNCTTYCQNY